MVCRHKPPPPGCHCGRCGWLNNPRSSDQVCPASFDSNNAAGSTPQYILSGSCSRPTAICQICFRACPVSSGNLIGELSGLVHILPKSSLECSMIPKKFDEPAHSRCPHGDRRRASKRFGQESGVPRLPTVRDSHPNSGEKPLSSFRPGEQQYLFWD